MFTHGEHISVAASPIFGYTTGEWLESIPQSTPGHISISRISGVVDSGSDGPERHFVPSIPIKLRPRLSQTKVLVRISGSERFEFSTERGICITVDTCCILIDIIFLHVCNSFFCHNMHSTQLQRKSIIL